MEETINRIEKYNPKLAKLLKERHEIQRNHTAILSKLGY